MITRQACLYRPTDCDQLLVTDILNVAVSTAHALGIHKSEATQTPFEAEICRRCWWTLCQIETQRSLEPELSTNEILVESLVPLPLNINDIDLDPSLDILPEPRAHATDMSYFFLILEATRLIANQKKSKHQPTKDSSDSSNIPQRCEMEVVADRVRTIEQGSLRYCDTSRPFDWFILLTARAILVSTTPICGPNGILNRLRAHWKLCSWIRQTFPANEQKCLFVNQTRLGRTEDFPWL